MTPSSLSRHWVDNQAGPSGLILSPSGPVNVDEGDIGPLVRRWRAGSRRVPSQIPIFEDEGRGVDIWKDHDDGSPAVPSGSKAMRLELHQERRGQGSREGQKRKKVFRT